MAQISLTFPDGSVRDYKRGMTGAALAESHEPELLHRPVNHVGQVNRGFRLLASLAQHQPATRSPAP